MTRRLRYVTVPEGGWRDRILTKTLATTQDPQRALDSRWMWGAFEEGGETVYRLRVLGVLHTLFGIAIVPKVKEED